jgi:diguanylate cyclase (GGDEF)-like protein
MSSSLHSPAPEAVRVGARRWLRADALIALLACSVAAATIAEGGAQRLPLLAVGLAIIAWLLLVLRRQHGRLHALAWTDPLTGLLNHRGFHERLDHALARARREGASVALVTLDLDNFKRVNDRHGHPYGDEVLRAVGAGLRGVVRSADVVARVGGEEFALILPGAGVEDALSSADRAREAVARVPVHEFQLSCSAGVASFPGDADGASALCQRADGALYWAKRTGKQRTRCFDPAHVLVGDRSERVEALSRLLEDPEGIAPVFQPVVALATGRIVGYEALARFPRAPDVAPQTWFSEARACGLGSALEAAAIRAALGNPGRPHGTTLGLNVSPSALLGTAIREALPESLRGIVLEITEHEEVSDPDVIAELNRLRSRGAWIAIDDTGAGHAGLTQLTQIRPEVVKLDRELISEIHSDPIRLALVESFVRYARQVGASVCAEGIESLDDLGALANLDVTLGQGFALAAPRPDWPQVDVDAVRVCRESLVASLRGAAPGATGWTPGGDRLLERLSASLADARSRRELEQVLGLIAVELDAEAVAISSWSPEEHCVETLAESGSPPREGPFSLDRFPLTARALDERIACQVHAGDPRADPDEIELMASLGYRSLLIMPVVSRGRSVGILEAYSRRERDWTRAEISRARVVANQLANAVESHSGAGIGV